MAFSNVYTFGPTFRAENSNTTRHAAEFWMIEPEIAFADLSDDMKLAEDMIKYVIAYVLEQCPEEMNFLQPVRGQGPARAPAPRHDLRFRPRHLYRGHRDSRRAQATSSTIRSSGAATSRPSMSATSPSRFSSVRSSSPTIRRRSRPSICSSTPTARPSRPWTASCPASARSSAAASVRSDYDVLLTRMNELGLKPEDYQVLSRPAQIRHHHARGLRPRLRAPASCT